MRVYNRANVPLLVWIVLGCTFLSVFVRGSVLGFNISGLSWVLPLFFSVLIIGFRAGRFYFPVWIWVPWIMLLILNLLAVDASSLDLRVNPLQRTAQVLTPLVVGMASSTGLVNVRALEQIVRLFGKSSYLLLVGSVLISASTILAGQPSSLAAPVMTGLLLAIFFMNRYLLMNSSLDLRYYLLMAILPVIAITRTVMAVVLLSVPLSFAPIRMARRVAIVLVFCVIGIGAFYLPQVQEKMFFSGHGELSDVSLANPDFATSGRSFMWGVVAADALNKPWLGHGTGSSESITYAIADLAYPHNDWLLTFHDYGAVGVVIYLLCNLGMLWHCYISAKKTRNKTIKLFFLAGASSFIPFMMVMFTDNIMVYASYFGNLQYLIIGLAYGALGCERKKLLKIVNENQNAAKFTVTTWRGRYS